MADATFDWDIVVEPGDTKKASAMFTNGAVVSAASKNQEAAQKWVTFLTSSDDMVKTRLATSWELPPVADNGKVAPLPDRRQARQPAGRLRLASTPPCCRRSSSVSRRCRTPSPRS